MESECTFVDYKPVSNTVRMPGAASCAQDLATGLFVNQPPIPVGKQPRPMDSFVGPRRW
jgi:hypothetical protein